MSDAARARFAGESHAFCIYLEDGHVGAAGAEDIVVVVREAHIMHRTAMPDIAPKCLLESEGRKSEELHPAIVLPMGAF